MRFFKFYEKSMEIFSFFAWSYCRILLTAWNDPNYFLENIYFCCFRVKTGPKWGFSSFMGNLPMEIFDLCIWNWCIIKVWNHRNGFVGGKFYFIVFWSKRPKMAKWGRLSFMANWNFFIVCSLFVVVVFFWRDLVFKFIEVFHKITPWFVKHGCGRKFFKKVFVLQSISCSKVIRIFNSWLNRKPFRYLSLSDVFFTWFN